MPSSIDKYAQGIRFTYGGATVTATSIAVSQSGKEYDVTHCGLEKGPRMYRYGPYKNTELQVEFIGEVTSVSLTATQAFAFTFTGEGTHAQSLWPTPNTGSALCTSFSGSAVAGDLFKGSMTLRLT